MKFKKIVALFMAAVCTLSMSACKKDDENTVTDSGLEVVETTEAPKDVVLNFWYTDANMTGYFTCAAEKYMYDNPNVTINLDMVASNGYLENINTQSIRQTNAVDIYMLPNAELEQAYLAGLALEYDIEDTFFNVGNFGNSAIRAVTYDNKQVAYPLYFDSAFLLYNKAYVTDVPTTFDALLNFSNSLEYSEEGSASDNIEKTFTWPVSDYTFNYAFLSDAFVVGGKNGDDRTQVNTNNETVIAALEYYHSLYDFFAIDRMEIDYEQCIEDFIAGKTAFTLGKTGIIPTLDAAEGLEYGVARMPDISETIAASSLSYTQTLVINPYSLNVNEAEKFVKAISCDYVDVFYGMTGYYPSYKHWPGQSEIMQGIYDNYDDSTPRPKMMTLGDYYIHLEILLHTVWDDNAETVDVLNEMQEFLTTQLN